MDNHCRICLQPHLVHKWHAKGYEWLQCMHCNSLQTSRVLSSQQLEAFYDDSYFEGHGLRGDQGAYIDYIGQRHYIEQNLKRRVDWTIQHIESTTNRWKWLDIGCAAGFLLLAVKEYGYVPYGIDYSEYGPSYARSELGLDNVYRGTLAQFPHTLPVQYNVISFIDVLEHVTDPSAMLHTCCELLLPGGYLLGETFDPLCYTARILGSNWHAIDPPNHFAIASLEGIDQVLVQHNMVQIGLVRLPRILSLSSVASKFGKLGIKLSHKIHKTALDNISIPIWLGDVALWLYRKMPA